jgi:hypothetical protein
MLDAELFPRKLASQFDPNPVPEPDLNDTSLSLYCSVHFQYRYGSFSRPAHLVWVACGSASGSAHCHVFFQGESKQKRIMGSHTYNETIMRFFSETFARCRIWHAIFSHPTIFFSTPSYVSGTVSRKSVFISIELYRFKVFYICLFQVSFICLFL